MRIIKLLISTVCIMAFFTQIAAADNCILPKAKVKVIKPKSAYDPVERISTSKVKYLTQLGNIKIFVQQKNYSERYEDEVGFEKLRIYFACNATNQAKKRAVRLIETGIDCYEYGSEGDQTCSTTDLVPAETATKPSKFFTVAGDTITFTYDINSSSTRRGDPNPPKDLEPKTVTRTVK